MWSLGSLFYGENKSDHSLCTCTGRSLTVRMCVCNGAQWVHDSTQCMYTVHVSVHSLNTAPDPIPLRLVARSLHE